MICCKTGIGTDLLRFQVARYDSFFFKTNSTQCRCSSFACPLVLLFTLGFVCSAVHRLLLYRSVSICIPRSVFAVSMSHLVSISPPRLLLHECLSRVVPNTATGGWTARVRGGKNSAALSDFLVWFCICCDYHAWVNSWIATTEGCKARWYFVHFNNHFISKPPPWGHLTVRGTATFNSFSIPPVIICSLWIPPSRPQGGEEKCKETLEMTHQTLYPHQPASLIR